MTNAPATLPPARLVSLDALRGLDMAIILGLDSVVHEFDALFPESPFWQTASAQLSHVPWEGLHVYDLVFPLFVFLAGVSQSLSLRRRRALALAAGKPRRYLIWPLWRRAALLVALGWLVNGPLVWNPGDMRYASVLGLIGLSCALGGTVMVLAGPRPLRALAAALGVMLLTGGLQHAGGDFTAEGSINAAIDSLLCPGVLLGGRYDPEGLLAIVSATSLNLLGFFCAGLLPENGRATGRTFALWCATGACLLGLSTCGPVIKSIWTPYFTAAAGGIALGLMALFHAVVDLRGWKAWCAPFCALGANALFAYLLVRIIPFGELNDRIFGGAVGLLLPDSWQLAAMSLTSLLLAWLVLAALYRRRIFIRL